MCGITITTKGLKRGRAMVALLKHRGPDKQNGYVTGDVAVGHARLTIVDTDNPDAVQPYYEPSQYACAFNGEIFNYRQLTKSTEVALIADLLFNGHDLTQVLNGYYAVVMHDFARNKIVCTRDLYGVMPLYYTKHEGHFEAASERKALTGRTYEVPPNSRLEFDLRTKRIKVFKYSQPFRLSSTEASAAQLAESFKRAVQAVATHSDSGFSVALSGGLDSAMVLCALRLLHLKPHAIITTMAQTDDTSEVTRATNLTRQLGWHDVHHVVPVLPMPDEMLRYTIESKPNPIRDFAFKRHATVAYHSPTKVILCGEGADELGLGYPLHQPVNTLHEQYLKKVSLLKSQASMTLDRVNKAGMMYSKEYRVPFLDLDFSLMALNVTQRNKAVFRDVATHLGVPSSIISAPKYSNEETVGRTT